ncbi:SagB/ThcOx family dehydrogenase [Flavobacterium cerinum]|uniref:SagB/ThcOx family dehydrogenase n=1 Tax=Flavobacterium cerinum TaxID=2502784 RepID=A0ABY5IQE8_9FLAO|nr:SagB/ThcOx family dehydrogenase [Flavobacterium cerinum]UUC44013.1 SagB/ThcOx family dehydrogenase [Flavobacterium cerinum]
MNNEEELLEEKELLEEQAGFEMLGQAIEMNSTRTMSLSFTSTGLRTSELKYRCINADDRLAETFLVNSRLLRNELESTASMLHYFEEPVTKMLSLPRGNAQTSQKKIFLPKRLDLNVFLGDAIVNRKSVRQYTGDDIPLDFLATILFAAGGVTHKATTTLATGEEVELKFRSPPSGGGLYPIDLAVMVNNVRGLAKGIYKYDGDQHILAPWLGADDADAVLRTMAFPEEVISAQRSSAIILLIARPWRSMRKYGTRGMRLVFMESGYISQNIHLSTQALGFGSVDCSGMYDDELNKAIKLDGVFSTVVHSILIGCPE